MSSSALPARVTWGARELAAGFVGAFLLIFLLSLVIVAPVVSEYGEDTEEFYIASAAATIVWNAGYVGLVLWLIGRTGGGWSNLGLATFSFRPWLIVGGFLLSYVSVIVYGVLVDILDLGFLEPSQQLDEALYDSDVATALTGVAVVAGAPFAEEVLFRGFLFAGLRRWLPFGAAALLGGFIFSAAHLNLGLLIPFTAVGVILAYTYERSGTLITPIAVHFAFNSFSFLLTVFFPELRDTSETGWIAPILGGL